MKYEDIQNEMYDRMKAAIQSHDSLLYYATLSSIKDEIRLMIELEPKLREKLKEYGLNSAAKVPWLEAEENGFEVILWKRPATFGEFKNSGTNKNLDLYSYQLIKKQT